MSIRFLARVTVLSTMISLVGCTQPGPPADMTWVHPNGVLAPKQFEQAKATCTYQVDAAAPIVTNYQSGFSSQAMTRMDQNEHRKQLAIECMNAAGYQFVTRDEANANGWSQGAQRAAKEQLTSVSHAAD